MNIMEFEIDLTDLYIILSLIEKSNKSGIIPINDLELVGALYNKINTFLTEASQSVE